MKKYKLSTLKKLCLIIISCLSFITACENEDLVNTDQLASKEVTLQSFGPCPIARGAELRIIGTNLDKVESVTIPGAPAITEGGTYDAMRHVSATEIRVRVPQTAEVGFISLKAGARTITSITELTYSEPISISGITPSTIKAGGVIKIEGDYLNLIKEIIFLDDVHVLQADFVSQNRQAIEVIVPIKAQTGKVVVSNGADLLTEEEIEEGLEPGIPIWVYSDAELVVVLPTITAFSPETIRAGSELTITGEDFDLVEKVSFGGDIVAESFTVNDEKTTITVTVPDDAQDGSVALTAFSGVKVLSEEELTLVVPTISAISPNPVKNGAVLKVTGTDLDLINEVIFGGEKKGTIEEERSATEINVKVPNDAKDGMVIFVTLAKKEVQSAELTLVKPVVTAYSPSPVPAGSDVQLKGTDLDLVVSVTFANDLVVPATTDATDELTVNVPLNAVSGEVSLTMVNGETVKCPDIQIIEAVFAYLPTPIDPAEEILAGSLFMVEIANGDKLTDVQINGESVKYILSDPKLYILIPNSANGNTELKLVSSNGTATYTISVTPSGIVETVVWEGLIELSWNAEGIPNEKFADAKPGDRLRFYFSNLGTSPKLKLYYGDWSSVIVIEGDPNFIPGGNDDLLEIPAGSTYYDIVLSAAMIDKMVHPAWGSDAMLLMGQDLTVYKLSILSGNEPGIVLWTGSVGPIGWSGNDLIPIDVDLLVPGKTLGFDIVCEAGAQIEIMGGSWWEALPAWLALNNGERYIKDCDVSETNIEFVISQADIDCIKKQGTALLVCGGGVTVKRVYLK